MPHCWAKANFILHTKDCRRGWIHSLDLSPMPVIASCFWICFIPVPTRWCWLIGGVSVEFSWFLLLRQWSGCSISWSWYAVSRRWEIRYFEVRVRAQLYFSLTSYVFIFRLYYFVHWGCPGRHQKSILKKENSCDSMLAKQGRYLYELILPSCHLPLVSYMSLHMA